MLRRRCYGGPWISFGVADFRWHLWCVRLALQLRNCEPANGFGCTNKDPTLDREARAVLSGMSFASGLRKEHDHEKLRDFIEQINDLLDEKHRESGTEGDEKREVGGRDL